MLKVLERTADATATPAAGSLGLTADAEAQRLRLKSADGDTTTLSTYDGLAIYHPADFLPDGETQLTGANLLASITNAYNQAVADAAAGAVIQIPLNPNGWDVAAESLDLYGGGYNSNIWIAGPATLYWPDYFEGECIRLRGSSPATQAWGRGGVRDIIIASRLGGGRADGMVLDACVLTHFQNLLVQGLGLGRGWVCRDWQGGNENSQNCVFINCGSTGNGTNWDIQNLTISTFINCDSRAASICDFKLDQCQRVTFKGVCTQSIVPRTWDLSGNGGNRISIENGYDESVNLSGTFMYLPSPSVTYNQVTVSNYTISERGVVFDQGTSVNLTVSGCEGLGDSPVIHRMRGSNNFATFIDCLFTPDNTPSKFDYDATSAARATHMTTGAAHFGSKLAADSLVTAAYAPGSEPASPVASQKIWNTATARPRIYTGTAWRDGAYADDPLSITEILRPYAADIWDLSIPSKRSLVGSTLDHVVGLINGSVLQENSGGASRPTFTASDPNFGGRASVTFVNTSSTFLTTTLLDPIVAGEFAAYFVVLRMTDATFFSGHDRKALILNGTGGISLGCADWNVVGGTWYTSQFAQTTIGGSDVFPHAVYSDAWAANANHGRIYVDGVYGGNGVGVMSAAATSLASFQVGGKDASNVSNFSISYVALLHRELPDTDRTRVFQLALAQNAIA